MQALEISVESYTEGVGENIAYSLSLNLPELQLAPCTNDGTLIIAGSGPSLANHVDEIREARDRGITVCGIKGAYDYLRDKGVTPNLYISVEPRYRPVRLPSRDTAFLLASRVHQDVFKELKGHCVYLWHSWGTDEDDQNIPDRPFRIGGGTTSGLRAINVGYILGFRKFELYGFDCCLGENGNKRVMDEPLAEGVETIDVHVGGREFVCNMAMAQQANDFQMIYQIMPDIAVKSHGDGLITAIIEERRKQGMKT